MEAETMDRTSPDPRQLSNRELDALYSELQQRAFEHFDLGALKAESGKLPPEAAMAQAQALADPLIARASEVNAERVRRLRRAARAYRIAALVVAVTGALLVMWMLANR
jgi:hypothetical protein